MMMMFPIFLYIYYMYINKLLRDTMFYYYSFGINMTTKKKTQQEEEENSKKRHIKIKNIKT